MLLTKIKKQISQKKLSIFWKNQWFIIGSGYFASRGKIAPRYFAIWRQNSPHGYFAASAKIALSLILTQTLTLAQTLTLTLTLIPALALTLTQTLTQRKNTISPLEAK